MPEFRRGWARFLPREAERDLFHPSLEDLRAEHVKGIRLQIATAVLWLDCWRVWLFHVDPPEGGHHRERYRCHRHLIERTIRAMFIQDVRRALRLFRTGAGLRRRGGADARPRHWRQHGALRGRRGGAVAPVAGARCRRARDPQASRPWRPAFTKEFIGLGDLLDLRDRQQIARAARGLRRFPGHACSETTSRCASRDSARRRKCSRRCACSRRWAACSTPTTCARSRRRS